MALNKNALIRYKTIDYCFRNRQRKWTLDDLIERCSDALYEYEGKDANVSKRTVQLDIQMMRSDKLGYNAPIVVYDRKYYKYDDDNYSIINIPVTDVDVKVMNDAIQLLKQFKDFSLFKEMDGVLQRLEDSVYTAQKNQRPIIHLDKNEMLKGLENDLAEITGFDAVTLQPNSGAQGEYAGLMVIRAYHESRGDHHRNIALIPSSAHGTNPASAVMAGMKVVVTQCDENGNIDVADFKEKATLHKDNLSCTMITYPSTHGVFEESIIEITNIIHENGGQVYMDGANMNAQVGLTNPANIGADVCHLNLHKTFAIPHGGGGPGVGPIGVAKQLTPFLPSNPMVKVGGEQAITAISAAPYGSAYVCLISYAYIKMLGTEGLKDATKMAILNANYLKTKLEENYKILYTNDKGRVAHEMILECRDFKGDSGVEAGDIAKRLMDYGFHAPTVSFPVAGTLMVEPTESESKEELDRFVEVMVAIRKEVQEIIDGKYDKENNPIQNAPHTAEVALSDAYSYPYSRTTAVYPLPWLKEAKYWPTIGKADNAYGDRNLVCSCIGIEAYAEG